MYRIGIGTDTNSDHEMVWRDSECEIHQRIKWLSSTQQQFRQLKSIDDLLVKIHLKKLDQYNKYNSLRLENKQCKSKLEYLYLFSNKSYMYAKSTFKHLSLCYCKERKWHRRLARKIKELAAKDETLKAKNPKDQYRRDAIDQKIFTAKFSRKDSHNMLHDDMRTETLTRRN